MAIQQRQVKKTHLALAAHASMIEAKESLAAMQSHQLESFGLTISRFRVLEMLLRGGPMSQSELGALLFWGHSNTHFLVTKLEGFGLVVRKPQERDKRVVEIHLTPEGEKLIAEAFPLHAMLVRAQMSVLDMREQETLCRLCRKLSQGDSENSSWSSQAVRARKLGRHKRRWRASRSMTSQHFPGDLKSLRN